MTRRESREQAFILLFEKTFQQEVSMDELINSSIENGYIKDDEFANRLAALSWEKHAVIDEIISKFLTTGWKLNRLSRVCISVLRLAVCELMYYDDIPVKVSINEAVELCKVYASDDERVFVNGILRSVAETVQKG